MTRKPPKQHRDSDKAVSKRLGILGHAIIVTLGLGLLAGAVSVLHPYTRAHIQLHRDANQQVRGAIRYLFAGVPIFWQSLDGFDHLENQDFTRGHFTPKTKRYQGEMTITRLGFVDAPGRTLAWSQRAGVWNDQDAIKRFLEGKQARYEFMQEPPFDTTFRAIRRTLLGLALAPVGIFVVLSGFRVPVWKLLPLKVRSQNSDS